MRRRIVIWGGTLLLTLVVGGGVLWVGRSRAIVYRADAGECGVRVTFSEPGGERRQLENLGPFEREVSLTHGEVANLVVAPMPGCPDRAHCVIVEDGVAVSEARGWAGASCSAATAR